MKRTMRKAENNDQKGFIVPVIVGVVVLIVLAGLFLVKNRVQSPVTTNKIDASKTVLKPLPHNQLTDDNTGGVKNIGGAPTLSLSSGKVSAVVNPPSSAKQPVSTVSPATSVANTPSGNSSAPANTQQIYISDSKIIPQSVQVSPNTEIIFINSGSQNHKIDFVNQGSSTTPATVLPQGTLSFVLLNSGTYNYQDSSNPSLKGNIIVK